MKRSIIKVLWNIRKPRFRLKMGFCFLLLVGASQAHSASLGSSHAQTLAKQQYHSQAYAKQNSILQEKANGSLQQLSEETQKNKHNDVKLSTLDESGRLLQQFCFDIIVHARFSGRLLMANV